MAVFLFLAVVFLMSGISIIFVKEPTTNILLLLVSLTAIAGLFALYGSPFLAVVQLLVYAGAGVVLLISALFFLPRERRSPSPLRLMVPGLLWLLLLAVDIAVLLPSGRGTLSASPLTTTRLSSYLLHDLLLPFVMVSLLLVITVTALFLWTGKERGE